MQIIESSILGVRSARLVLKHNTSKVTVILFPMIHVGEASFYTTVYADAFSHDYVLTEGVKSPVTRRLTRTYKWIVKKRGIGLCVQPAWPSQDDVSAKIVHADLSTEEFMNAWQEISLKMRFLIYIFSFIVAFRNRWFITRDKLARDASLDDLPSRDSYISWDPELSVMQQLIIDKRDQRLIEKLNTVLVECANVDTTIAVVYGARHMPAVISELCKKGGFHVSSSEWMTVYSML